MGQLLACRCWPGQVLPPHPSSHNHNIISTLNIDLLCRACCHHSHTNNICLSRDMENVQLFSSDHCQTLDISCKLCVICNMWLVQQRVSGLRPGQGHRPRVLSSDSDPALMNILWQLGSCDSVSSGRRQFYWPRYLLRTTRGVQRASNTLTRLSMRPAVINDRECRVQASVR